MLNHGHLKHNWQHNGNKHLFLILAQFYLSSNINSSAHTVPLTLLFICSCLTFRSSQSSALCWGSSFSPRTISSRPCCSIQTDHLPRQPNWWAAVGNFTSQSFCYFHWMESWWGTLVLLCFSLLMDKTSTTVAVPWGLVSPNSLALTSNTIMRRAGTSPGQNCHLETAWSIRPWLQGLVRTPPSFHNIWALEEQLQVDLKGHVYLRHLQELRFKWVKTNC